MRFSVSLFLFSILITIPFISYAQWGESMNINVSPENPKPGEQITLSLEGVSAGLESAQITWFVNEKIIEEGAGLKQITIIFPNVGETKVIRVEAVSYDGSMHTQSITLGGARVMLLWESKTYTPPFFDGRSRHSNGATAIFQAITNFKDSGGNTIDPKSLIYTWKKEGKVMQDVSGRGKDSYVFTDDGVDSSTQISVAVSSIDQQFSGSDSVVTRRSIPGIVFYRYSLLWGTDFGMQSTGFTGQKEIGIRAVPLYFPVDLTYRFSFPILEWKLSGKTVETKNLPYLIIQNNDNAGATGSLSVSIKNPNYFGEDAQKKATLNFK